MSNIDSTGVTDEQVSRCSVKLSFNTMIVMNDHAIVLIVQVYNLNFFDKAVGLHLISSVTFCLVCGLYRRSESTSTASNFPSKDLCPQYQQVYPRILNTWPDTRCSIHS